MCRVTIDHNNTILGGDDLNEDNPETIVFVRLIAWCNIDKSNVKHLKKDRRRTNALSMAYSKSV